MLIEVSWWAEASYCQILTANPLLKPSIQLAIFFSRELSNSLDCWFVCLFVFNMADSMETKLKSPPEDAISSVMFSPGSSQFLLASSWDSSVRPYDVVSNSLRLKYNHERSVLDICFQVFCHFFLKIILLLSTNINIYLGCYSFIQWWSRWSFKDVRF